MRGTDLVQQCKEGDRIELTHLRGKIHTLYADSAAGQALYTALLAELRLETAAAIPRILYR